MRRLLPAWLCGLAFLLLLGISWLGARYLNKPTSTSEASHLSEKVYAQDASRRNSPRSATSAALPNIGSLPKVGAPGERPNILFILADDLGYTDIGAYNPETFYETPRIDALAKRGMRFTQGYTACCVCSPTRASILTGRYPPRTGVTDFIPGGGDGRLLSAPNSRHLPVEEITIAETFRATGYETFYSGKWHLGLSHAHYPGEQGFPKELVNPEGENSAGHFWYPSSGEPVLYTRDDPKSSERIANDFAQFISEKRDKPFFAYLPFPAVHKPLEECEELVAKYRKKKAGVPKTAWGRESGRRIRQSQDHPVYAAMIERMDSAIGRILNALEENDLTENTIVIFTSDNGGLATGGCPTSNLPLRAGKGWAYEGGVRVPMIVVAPGVTEPGSVCDAPVTTTDYYPTLLQLAGLDLQPGQHLDGVSFVPQLAGRSEQRGKPLFWHYPHYNGLGGSPYGAIRDGDWKLIEWYEDGALELYHLSQDIGEKKNLAERAPKKTQELLAKLHAWRQEAGAQMPTPNPDYRPDESDTVVDRTARRESQSKTE